MEDKLNKDYFNDVWEELQSLNAVQLLKEEYIAQMDFINLEDLMEEQNLNLNDKQKDDFFELLAQKVKDIRNGKYDEVFIRELQEEIKCDIDSENKMLGGMTPREYLGYILSEEGALFFFDIEAKVENGELKVIFDIDRNELDWQAFD